MTQSPLARLAGPIALTDGVLICASQLGMSITLDVDNRRAALSSALFVASMATYFAALCVLLLALVATYERQAHRAGTFGLIAFGAAFVGTVFLAGNHWFDTFAGPWIADAAPELLTVQVQHPVLTTAALTSYVLFAAGWVLYGIASLRARIYPAAASIAIVAGGAIGVLALSAPLGIPLGLAVGALGAWITWTVPNVGLAPQTAGVGGE